MVLLKSLRVIVIVLGILTMLFAPLAWKTLYSFGHDVNGYSTHCSTHCDSWFSKEAVYIFWIPFFIGFGLLCMAWPLTRKIKRLSANSNNNFKN